MDVGDETVGETENLVLYRDCAIVDAFWHKLIEGRELGLLAKLQVQPLNTDEERTPHHKVFAMVQSEYPTGSGPMFDKISPKETKLLFDWVHDSLTIVVDFFVDGRAWHDSPILILETDTMTGTFDQNISKLISFELGKSAKTINYTN